MKLVLRLRSLRRSDVADVLRQRKGLLAAAVLTGVAFGWHLGLIMVIAVPTWDRHRIRRRHLADKERIANALPDGIDMLMLLIQSGCSPTRAFEQLRTLCAPELQPAIDKLLHLLHRGQRLSEAVTVLITDLGPQMIAVVDALRSADHYGTPLGPAFDRISDQLHRERQHRAEVAAHTLSVRITFPLVLCILPAFALSALGPVVLSALSAVASLDIR
jgi:pilus assembly protein TadC